MLLITIHFHTLNWGNIFEINAGVVLTYATDRNRPAGVLKENNTSSLGPRICGWLFALCRIFNLVFMPLLWRAHLICGVRYTPRLTEFLSEYSRKTTVRDYFNVTKQNNWTVGKKCLLDKLIRDDKRIHHIWSVIYLSRCVFGFDSHIGIRVQITFSSYI